MFKNSRISQIATTLKFILAITFFITLSACGGGGGGEESESDWSQATAILPKGYVQPSTAISNNGNAIITFLKADIVTDETGASTLTQTFALQKYDRSAGNWRPMEFNLHQEQEDLIQHISTTASSDGQFNVLWGKKANKFESVFPTIFSSNVTINHNTPDNIETTIWNEDTQSAPSQVKTAYGSKGDGIVIWSEIISQIPRTYALAFREYSPNTGWSSKRIMPRSEAGYLDPSSPFSVAVDGKGYKHVAFPGYSDVGTRVFIVASGSGDAWEFKSFPDQSSHQRAALGADDNGNVMLVMRSMSIGQTPPATYYSFKRFDSNWTAPSTLISETDSPGVSVEFAMSANGDAIATWNMASADNTNVVIWARRWENGNWLPKTLISGKIPIWATDFTPVIAMDKEGNAVIAWNRYSEGTPAYAMASGYKRGTGWRTPQRIWHDETSPSWNLQIAMAENGNSLLTWTDNSTPGQGRLWGSFKKW